MNTELFLTIVSALLVARVLNPLADRVGGAMWGGRRAAVTGAQAASSGSASSRSIP